MASRIAVLMFLVLASSCARGQAGMERAEILPSPDSSVCCYGIRNASGDLVGGNCVPN